MTYRTDFQQLFTPISWGSEIYRFEDDRTRHRAALRSQNLQVSPSTDQTHLTIIDHDQCGYLNPQDSNPSTNPVSS